MTSTSLPPHALPTLRQAVAAGMPVFFLVALAGATDALMVLHSMHLFAVYVTGDTAKIGVALSQGRLGAIVPLLAVVLVFFAATTLAAWAGRAAGRLRGTLLLAACAALTAAAAPLAATPYPLAAILLVAAAMGTLNQVRADEAGVTFITGTLVRTGRALAAGDWVGTVMGMLRWASFLAGVILAAWLDARLAPYTLGLVAMAAALGAGAEAGWAWRAPRASKKRKTKAA
ncbi:DUF1275 family protein [Bordetella sp. BOR01]|uniref:DUF1275 family protein n=1 Tax=Bordetella sp. BOR01 TaxID=2854779 RepID=UPI001C471FC3|nr:DUF1275 family protein [Bordetella sp. BOR01]MBV7486557.1 DUF1275 family protein [Bordetella sp. BOR01]